MELELAASTVEVTTSGITIRWSDGTRSRFHALWLRDNCPTGGPKGSAHRTFSVVDLNPEIFVLDVEHDEEGDLVVEFSDGHDATFGFEWLRRHAHELHDRRGRARKIEHFRAGALVPRFDLPRSRSERHVDLLDALSKFGLAIVDGVPEGERRVEMLVDLLAGSEKGSRLAAGDVAATEADQRLEATVVEAHTLGTHQRVPPGLIFAFGDAVSDVILIDGFGITSALRDENPDEFDLLSEVSVPFIGVDAEWTGGPAHEVAHGPVISLDRDHEVAGIRHHEAAMAPLDIDPADVEEYYRALITFTSMVRDPARAVQVSLAAGQALLWDNHRVLTRGVENGPIEPMVAVDRGDFHAQLRRLRSEHDRQDVDERFPSGVITR